MVRRRLLMQLSGLQQQLLQQQPPTQWLAKEQEQVSVAVQVKRLAISFIVATVQVEIAGKLLQVRCQCISMDLRKHGICRRHDVLQPRDKEAASDSSDCVTCSSACLQQLYLISYHGCMCAPESLTPCCLHVFIVRACLWSACLHLVASQCE